MKAITVWQPFASLLAYGGKRFETRSWAISYRGPIAIHAASLSTRSVINRCFPVASYTFHPDYHAKEQLLKALSEVFGVPYGKIMDHLKTLPTGAVVATANLIGCHEIARINEKNCYCDCNRKGVWIDVTDQEVVFGNWVHGRYAWEFSDMKIITPVPARGRQGLWNLDDSILK